MAAAEEPCCSCAARPNAARFALRYATSNSGSFIQRKSVFGEMPTARAPSSWRRRRRAACFTLRLHSANMRIVRARSADGPPSADIRWRVHSGIRRSAALSARRMRNSGRSMSAKCVRGWVDGTLIEAWASLKSFQCKDQKNPPPDDPGNPTIDFHGETRSNQTHESATDADALLARKGSGKEAKLSYTGNLLVENRNGLIVTTELFQANGTAERDAALVMLEQISSNHRVTLGADKGYDTRDFVVECRNLQVTPHVAQNTKRRGGSAIDERTTRHAGYGISQTKRKRIEESFGWLKTIALMRKVRHRGIHKVGWVFTFAAAAYNLVRMRNLLSPAVQSA